MAAALRKCMAMGDAEVIECVANLATVRHEDLNRLLSALFRNVMQHLVVATAAARDRVTERLTAGRVRQVGQHFACPPASSAAQGSAANLVCSNECEHERNALSSVQHPSALYLGTNVPMVLCCV